jgi:hypothetical protein
MVENRGQILLGRECMGRESSSVKALRARGKRFRDGQSAQAFSFGEASPSAAYFLSYRRQDWPGRTSVDAKKNQLMYNLWNR